MSDQLNKIIALLGPTNTGKTYIAIEKMLEFNSGIFGLPLRLLTREVYDKCVKKMTEEAGGEMDYVYQAIIIQTCKAETEEKNNNDS